ncbi:hypothetical protein PseudUWO311_06795 [Pseudanabaena sp. UWO311]|uniref:hypothetical protein n=1 Tax=Pseudanabaena sp. UWO311 TaxID=2487337 RepID=UPI0011595BA3|nr:hypothetical protein [Pseudanabaena sp. UWO311]TYQ28130.1 hypothetical protein PseudUWO311_06795 [Pseudanabaena sp. UWO311]
MTDRERRSLYYLPSQELLSINFHYEKVCCADGAANLFQPGINDAGQSPASLILGWKGSTTSKCRKKAEKVIAIMTVRDILSPIICQLNLSNRI